VLALMNCASLSPISTACYPGILKHRCSSLDAHDRIIGIDLGFMKVKFARYEVFLDKTKVKSSNIEKKTNSTSIGIPLPI